MTRVAGQSGEPDHTVVVLRDCTAQREAERRLQRSEARLELALEASRSGMWDLDLETDELQWSESMEALHGLPPGGFGGTYEEFMQLVHPDDRERLRSELAAAEKRGEDYAVEFRIVRPDGIVRWRTSHGRYVRDRTGRPTRVIGLGQDVTERRHAEDELRRERDFVRTLVESQASLVIASDREGRLIRFNRACEELTGYRLDDVRGRTTYELFIPEDELAAVAASVERVFQGDAVADVENDWVLRDGSRRRIAWKNTAIRDQHGTVEYVLSSGLDVTERVQAEQAIRDSEARSRTLLENPPDFIVWMSRDGIFLDLTGASTDAIHIPIRPRVGMDVRDVLPAEAARLRLEAIERALDTGETQVYEYALTTDQRSFEREARVMPLPTDEVIVIVRDVTDQRRLEQQLRQVQKMEAIGRLAGGVAHDFNNLLTAISGNSELLHGSLAGRDLERLGEIEQAADRAADLTGELLAFSRQQLREPSRIELNKTVVGMERLLERLIGEDIELSTRLDPTAGTTLVGKGQVEQVIMNLVINARDAMPEGGRLRIETARMELDQWDIAAKGLELMPGDYVCLVVSDDGIGMDANVRAQLFEPFFTTKEPDQGTGLGLATVYGIVKQTHGDIAVASEPGAGSSFCIYLPSIAAGAPETVQPQRAAPRLDSRTALLVEDDERVRRLLATVLEDSGLVVLAAANGEQALELAPGHDGAVDALVTDVVMPHMSGPQLADELHVTRPAAKVLFMSGYADDQVLPGQLEPGRSFLQKPFSINDLLRRLEELLEAPA